MSVLISDCPNTEIVHIIELTLEELLTITYAHLFRFIFAFSILCDKDFPSNCRFNLQARLMRVPSLPPLIRCN